MTVDALSAARLYAQAAGVAADAPVDKASAPDFGGMLKTAIADAGETMRAGETAAAQAAVGEANLVDVVTAISAAEVSLETAISIRNRVIEAYQEIMRMPI